MIVPRGVWFLTVGLLVGGCADARAPARLAGEDHVSTGVPDGRIVADFEVTSASDRRRYHVETIQGNCTRRISDRGGWWIRFASDASQPSNLELSIPDATAAERGTERFALSLEFPEATGAVVHEIDATPEAAYARGGGRTTVLDNGLGATVVVEGLTRDGVRLAAVIRCRHVMRMAAPDAGE